MPTTSYKKGDKYVQQSNKYKKDDRLDTPGRAFKKIEPKKPSYSKKKTMYASK